MERDPQELIDRLDWVARRALIEEYRDAEGLAWDDYALIALDLEYANIDPDEGLRAVLEEGGHLLRLTDEAAVAKAMADAPQNTRAAIRGELVKRFAEQIGVAGWSVVVLRSENESWAGGVGQLLDAGCGCGRPGRDTKRAGF